MKTVVYNRNQILKWHPREKIQLVPNEDMEPMLRPYQGELPESPFQVQMNGEVFSCVDNGNGKLKLNVGDVRYNCCPVFLENSEELLGVYFCSNMLFQHGYCYRDVQLFVQREIKQITQFPLKSLVEFSPELIFLEYESNGDTSRYQCSKLKKIVEKHRNLGITGTFRVIKPGLVSFRDIREKEDTVAQYRPYTHIRFPGDEIHPTLGCLVHSFVVEEQPVFYEEKSTSSLVSDVTMENTTPTYFSKENPLILRKKTLKSLLTKYND